MVERQKSECGRHEGEHVAVLGRGRGHNGRVEGHVRRRLDVKAVDARTDARELTRSPAVVPPPSRTALATSFLVFRARKATRAIISVVGGRLRVFSPRVSLFAPPRLSPWRPFPPLALPARGAPSLPCALRNLDFSVLEIFNVS